ncbi:hypothetical protein QB607_003158 [Clostridium botulinum]|nr:hypothetical protein [Clostridium botulinum]EKS4395831.1 hypothetical protein [Clostridium botulinum]
MDNCEQIGLAEVLNDKIDENKQEFSSNVTRQKQNIITISVDEEWIENNLIDMPFIYYYQNKSKEKVVNAVKYTWKSNDGLERCIEVRSSIHGVPSPFEYEVLLALLRIHFRNNNDVVISNKKISNKINFTFRELSKEMGFKGFGGKNKERLDKAIEVLCDTNIYNTAFGGLYDPVEKTYITDAKKVVGILGHYETYSYINTDGNPILDRKSLKDKASVVIDEFFFNNICNGKGKISNKSLRLSLKNDLARRIYLIINKWRNNRNEMYITYKKLYERIPLDDSKTVSYRNRRIRSACQELKDKKYLKDYEANKEGIIFVFKNKNKDKKSPDTTQNLLLRYTTYTEVLKGLLKYGFTYEEVDKYLELDKIPMAQAILRYVDIHINNIDNPKFYIIGTLIKGNKDILNNPIYSEAAITK